MLKFAIRGESLSDGGGFRAAGIGAERENDSELIEDDGGILYKHGIREKILGGQRNYVSAEFLEQLFIGAMLLDCDREINRRSRNETKLAIQDGGTDGTGDGCEHCEGSSLHEVLTED